MTRAIMLGVAVILLALAADARDTGLIWEAKRTAPPPLLQDTPDQETRLEVAMGEWAVALERNIVRPGTVTFVIQNRGTKTHGFRIRPAGRSRDRFDMRAPLMPPGGTSLLTVKLTAGLYRVDCYVEEPGVGEHDMMGMRTSLTVSAEASLTTPKSAPSGPASKSGDEQGSGNAISIAKFSYIPLVLKVKVGTTVVWANNDSTQHTINSDDGSFRSKMMEPGTTFSWTFDTPGVFPYKCMLHPAMKGTVEVSP